MGQAICMRCGDTKSAFDAVCAGCGHRPDGDGLLTAWVLSSPNLDAASLDAAAARIRAGEQVRPSDAMLERARRALGRRIATDPGLAIRELWGLVGANLVFSPLVGWTCAAWWYGVRPRAALQAVLLTLPFTLASTGAWVWIVFGGQA